MIRGLEKTYTTQLLRNQLSRSQTWLSMLSGSEGLPRLQRLWNQRSLVQ